MSNRWFTLAVVLLWLASMTWLIADKVAPPLRVGERPNVATDEARLVPGPVAWQLSLNEQPLGWATTDSLQRPDRVLEMRNRVHLNRFPLKEIAPWLARMLDPEGRDGQLPFDADSRVELVDGMLQAFRTSVSFGELTDAILVNGTARGDELQLNVRSGDFSYNTTASLAADQLLGNSLSPRTQLRNLRVGQTWTEPVYNPLHPPNNPLQILQATVERYEPLAWNGQILRTALVIYRDDPGTDSSSRVARARVWVGADGNVLRQEVFLLGVKLLFVRLPPGQAIESPPPHD